MSKAVRTTTPATKSATKKPAAKPAVKKPVAAAPAAKAPAVKTAAKVKPSAKSSTKTKVKSDKVSAKREKTVRDSFNMPAADYALIGQLKARALAGAREVKKSELLRAGLRVLSALNDAAFKSALEAVPSVKTGRPGKKHKG